MKFFFIYLIIIIFIAGCRTINNSPVTITIMNGSAGSNRSIEEQVSIFKSRNPDINILLLETPEGHKNIYNQYINFLKQGNPDIDIYLIDIVWAAEFANSGWLLPLDDYVKKKQVDLNDFLEGPMKSCTWNKHIVALPWFTDAGILYYRKDLLEKYKLNVPRTWEDLRKSSEKILNLEKKTNPNMVGFVFQGDKYEGLVTNYLEYLWSNGGDVFNRKGEVTIDNPQGIEALRIYSDMIDISAPGITAFQEEDARNYFQSGNSIFMRNWPYAWKLLDDTNSPVKDKFAISNLPSKNGNLQGISSLGGWQLAVSKYSQHPDEAFRVIAFLTSSEQQSYRAIKGGYNPTCKSCYSNPEVIKTNPHMKYFFNIVLNAYPRPVCPTYNQISEIIQEEVHLTIKRDKKPEDAAKSMSKKLKLVKQEIYN